MSWKNDVQAAITILGGRAHLRDLYSMTGIVRVSRGKSIPREFQSAVRETLQRHRDLFRPIDGKGKWRLKRQ